MPVQDCTGGEGKNNGGDDRVSCVILVIATVMDIFMSDHSARGGSGNDEVSDYNGNPVTLNGGSGRDRCYSSDDDVLISCEASGPI